MQPRGGFYLGISQNHMISSPKTKMAKSPYIKLADIGIYYERKDALLLYLREISDIFENQEIKFIDEFEQMIGLYRQPMFNVLAQGTDSRNHLWQEVNKDNNPEIIRIIEKTKEREVQIAGRINQFVSCKKHLIYQIFKFHFFDMKT